MTQEGKGRAENMGFVHWTLPTHLPGNLFSGHSFILSPCTTIPFLLSGPVEFGSFGYYLFSLHNPHLFAIHCSIVLITVYFEVQ